MPTDHDLASRFVAWTCAKCGHRNSDEWYGECAKCGHDPDAEADIDLCDGCDDYTPGARCCGDCEDNQEAK